jgi:tetratricopeptide (TPR) repeat protein
LAILALIGLLALSLMLNNLGLLRARPAVPPAEFTVRIASFQTTGEDQRQGIIVAEQLNQALKLRITTPMNIGVLSSTPTSPAEALATAQNQGIDVLIWGQVAEGTTADQAGLRPNLLWLPSEPFVPRTWQGFDGHFALPVDYELAAQPLNGSVVLPLLLDSLNHFGRGDADDASVLLDTLRTDYGNVLRPELPAMLRAIIFWAEGMLPDAESAAREAAATDRPQQLNNLGATLLDQQKLEPAREALVRAIESAPELAQAHANLGRLFLDLGQPEAALDPLRAAAQLAPESPPIVATLGEAYRRNGQLQQARIAMQRVLMLDEDNGPALAEQSVLALTPVLTATKQLEWELELPPSRTLEQMVELRVQTETGIAQIEALRNEFLRQAAAYGVAGRQPMQRLAEKQAAVLEQELLNRRYQLMLVQIEQGRVLAQQQRSRLRRFWDAVRGARTPLQEAIATSVAALRQEPNLPLQYDYHYHQGRAAYLSGNTQLAQTQFDAAASLVSPESPAPVLRTRPEHHYGKARSRNALSLACPKPCLAR